ncbi:hypothetical protein JCM3766R1_001707 [Sporobolomyces carnicolor]
MVWPESSHNASKPPYFSVVARLLETGVLEICARTQPSYCDERERIWDSSEYCCREEDLTLLGKFTSYDPVHQKWVTAWKVVGPAVKGFGACLRRGNRWHTRPAAVVAPRTKDRSYEVDLIAGPGYAAELVTGRSPNFVRVTDEMSNFASCHFTCTVKIDGHCLVLSQVDPLDWLNGEINSPPTKVAHQGLHCWRDEHGMRHDEHYDFVLDLHYVNLSAANLPSLPMHPYQIPGNGHQSPFFPAPRPRQDTNKPFRPLDPNNPFGPPLR